MAKTPRPRNTPRASKPTIPIGPRNSPGARKSKPSAARPRAAKPQSRSPLIVANGISGATGRYAMEPQSLEAVARALKGQRDKEAAPRHVIQRGERLKQRSFTRALPFGVEPHDLTRAGWAIVFHEDEAAAVRNAMKPLVEHRRRQVGADTRVKELVYRTGETATAWLARHDVSWHNVTPEKVPYYLLWVGSPKQLPFVVTHEIDSDYCVGLLEFSTAGRYARYATQRRRLRDRHRRAHIEGGRLLRHAPPVRRGHDAQRRLAGGTTDEWSWDRIQRWRRSSDSVSERW